MLKLLLKHTIYDYAIDVFFDQININHLKPLLPSTGLTDKWSVLIKGLNSTQHDIIANILENQSRQDSQYRTSLTAEYTPYALPLIRNEYPALLVNSKSYDLIITQTYYL